MTESSIPDHIVITGAGGALGRAVVQHFLEQGMRLALIDRSHAALQGAFPQIDSTRHLLLEADVTDAAGMRDAAKRIVGAFGHVDTLVHVAGGFEMGEAVHELSRAGWDRMMDLNAWSFVAVAQALLPSMIQRKSGHVIAISAQSAGRGLARMAAYCASKSALQRLVESMAAELAPLGINVNSIAPSTLDTPANRHAMPDADPRNWVPTALAAQAIGFLASPAGAALHGRHLALDAHAPKERAPD